MRLGLLMRRMALDDGYGDDIVDEMNVILS